MELCDRQSQFNMYYTSPLHQLWVLYPGGDMCHAADSWSVGSMGSHSASQTEVMHVRYNPALVQSG